MEHFFSPNSGEDQTLFFPEFTWRPKKKKKVFTRNGTLFLSADLRSDAHQSQIIGGDADEDHTQIIGGCKEGTQSIKYRIYSIISRSL